jgi:hypothetical protein
MRQAIRPKHFILLTGAFIVVGAAAVAALNWGVDPLQYYRKAKYPPLFQPGKRYQNPALARTYDYDTVLIGTSLSENVSASEVESALGGTFLNLAMSGASMREQKLLLDVAIRAGHVRTVLWEINYEYLRGGPDWVTDFDGPFPFYLYDRNPFNELHTYLLSIDTLKSSLRILAGVSGLIRWEPQPLERMQAWDWKTDRKLGADELKKVWRTLQSHASQPEVRTMMGEITAANMNRSFDENVLPLLKAYPQTKFIFFFPPVSVLRHLFYDRLRPGTARDVVLNKRHIIRSLRDVPQVAIYDFQGVESVVTDFSKYYDLGHYSRGVHRWMLDSMAAGEHLATPEAAGAMEMIGASKSAAEWLAMIGVADGEPAPAGEGPPDELKEPSR